MGLKPNLGFVDLSDFSSVTARAVCLRAHGRRPVRWRSETDMGGLASHHGTSSHPHGRCLTLASSARGELMSGGGFAGGGSFSGR